MEAFHLILRLDFECGCAAGTVCGIVVTLQSESGEALDASCIVFWHQEARSCSDSTLKMPRLKCCTCMRIVTCVNDMTVGMCIVTKS